MSDLPSGWTQTNLGELGTYVNGGAFKSSDWQTSGRPIIRIQNLTGTSSKFNYFNGEVDPRLIVRRGDLLISWAATLGSYIWDGPEGVLNQHIFRVDSLINKRFHKYLIDHVLSELQRKTHGSGMVHITRKPFAETPVALPPPAEQDRIVAAIDEMFSRIEVAVATLGDAEQRLRQMTAAVLHHATTGKSADSSAGPGVAGRPQLPESWMWASVHDVATVQGGIIKNPKRVPRHHTAPFMRVANVGRNRLDLDDMHRIEVADGELARYRLKYGDLLVVEGNGSADQIGRSAMWRDEIPDCVHQNHLIRVRPGPRLVPEFLALYWNAPWPAQQIAALASSTSGLNTLSSGKVAAIAVAVPPLEEQRQIVILVDKETTRITRLRSAMVAATKRAANLKSAMLTAAFSGRLITAQGHSEGKLVS